MASVSVWNIRKRRTRRELQKLMMQRPLIMESLLRDLQEWYARQCDGEWEHSYGVRITTIDNPGWSVQIDLAGTAMADRPFRSLRDPEDDTAFQQSHRWMHCMVKDGKWEGYGDETKLPLLVKTFLDWAASEPARREG